MTRTILPLGFGNLGRRADGCFRRRCRRLRAILRGGLRTPVTPGTLLAALARLAFSLAFPARRTRPALFGRTAGPPHLDRLGLGRFFLRLRFGDRLQRCGFGGGLNGRRNGGRDRRDRVRGEPREWLDPKERRGQADLNSPFAKLAALKEQLEASKER